MNRQFGVAGALTIGFLFGALIPFAGAHPEDECRCECVCPDEILMIPTLHVPLTQESPIFLIETPVFPEPRPHPLLAEGPVQKALDVIERVEEAEKQMDAAEEAAEEAAAQEEK